jgi:hypothetical protein
MLYFVRNFTWEKSGGEFYSLENAEKAAMHFANVWLENTFVFKSEFDESKPNDDIECWYAPSKRASSWLKTS